VAAARKCRERFNPLLQRNHSEENRILAAPSDKKNWTRHVNEIAQNQPPMSAKKNRATTKFTTYAKREREGNLTDVHSAKEFGSLILAVHPETVGKICRVQPN
jgi:hypothetical protein